MRQAWAMHVSAMGVVGVLVSHGVTGAAEMEVRRRIWRQTGAERVIEDVRWLSPTRIVVASGRERTVVDLSARTIATMGTDERAVRRTTLDALRAASEKTRAAARQVRRRLPPEIEDAMMRLGADPDTRFTLSATGATARIAGLPAREFRLSSPRLAGTVWVTRLPLPATVREWRALADDLGGISVAGSKLGDALARWDGFPVRTEISIEGADPVRSEVVEIAERPPPAEVAAVPR